MLFRSEKTGDLSRENLFWDILYSRTYVCCGCYMLKSEYFFNIYPERRIPEYDVGQNFQMLLPFMFYHQCPTIPEQLYGVCVREGSHSRKILTKEEEYRKYRDYELLVDEIAAICHIEDKASRNRITYWKAKRRYYLEIKYGNRKEAMKASNRMLRCGDQNLWYRLKDYIWNYLHALRR